MGLTIPFLFSFIPLGVMIVSDLRERRIGVWQLVIFSILTLISAWIYLGGTTIVIYLISNFIFLTLLYAALGFYMCVLRRRTFSSFTRSIGLGDILFLPVLSPFFPLREFILFLTGAFLFSLVIYGIYRVLQRNNPSQTIPLVSTVGICFILYTSFRLWIY